MPARFEWVKARRNGKTLFVDGQARSSRHDPEEEGRRLLSNAALPPGATLIFFGIAPAYHVLEAAKANRPFYIVEAESELRAAGPELLKELADGESFSKPLSFWVSKFLTAADEASTLLEIRSKVLDLGKWAILENPSSPKSESESRFYEMLKKRLREELLDEVKRRSTEHHFAKRWVRNAVHTILSRKKISLLSELTLSDSKGDSKTALLISSGLSVEDDLQMLREHSKRLMTFALPGVFPLLVQNGVSVDALISTDGGYYNSCHFESVYRHSFQGLLLAPFSIYPSIPKRIEKTFFYFDDVEFAKILTPPPGHSLLESEAAALRNLLEANWIPMAGTAVVNAFQILKKLGFSTVVTSGIDFALSPFKSHAVSNITEERFFSEGTRFASFEYKYHRAFPMRLEKLGHPRGSLTHTDEKLKLYRRLSEEEAKRIRLALIPAGEYSINAESSKNVVWGTSRETDPSTLLQSSLIYSFPSLENFFKGPSASDDLIFSKIRRQVRAFG